MSLVLTRFRLVALGLAATAALAWTIGWMQPQHRLERSWERLLAMAEARRAGAIGKLLAEDYTDDWGYTKHRLIEDLRRGFFHFDALKIETNEVSVARDGDTAVITAILRVRARGTPQADRARATINGVFAPWRFQWRRERSFPWAWRLTRIDNDRFRPAMVRER